MLQSTSGGFIRERFSFREALGVHTCAGIPASAFSNKRGSFESDAGMHRTPKRFAQNLWAPSLI